MPGYGSQSHGHHHVEDGLRHQQQGYADDEEGGEGAVAFLCDTSYAYQQTDVKEYDYDASYQSEFLDDNSKDEVGECLAQEVPLYGITRTFAYNIAGGNGDACVGYLRVFVYVELGGGYFLVTREFLDTGTPRVKPVQERYIAVLCHQ